MGVYFFVYLFAEIVISALFASVCGFGTLILEMGLTALIGLISLSGSKEILKHTLLKLMRNEITKEDFIAKNLKLVVGSFLLLAPGVLSDLIGAYLIVRGYLQREKHSEIIDVEVIEDNDKNRH